MRVTRLMNSRYVGINHIVDINKVPGLLSGSIYSHSLTVEQFLQKNGDDTGFTMWILPWTVYIAIAKTDVLETCSIVKIS